jgi:adenylyltransferase/sulfurtransferase
LLTGIDLKNGDFEHIEILRDPDCPTCGKHTYELLGKPLGQRTSTLCGRDEFQVNPGLAEPLDLLALAESLRALGSVTVSPVILSFDNGSLYFKLFADGRAMIKGVPDEAAALSVYAEYVG